MKGLENNCIACHSAADPNLQAKAMTDGSIPPWKSEKDRPAEWANSANMRNMLPITYERNCMGCHGLNLPGGGPVLA